LWIISKIYCGGLVVASLAAGILNLMDIAACFPLFKDFSVLWVQLPGRRSNVGAKLAMA
jgi:hypothetical protein